MVPTYEIIADESLVYSWINNITSNELICHYGPTEIISTDLQTGFSVYNYYSKPKNYDILYSLLSEKNNCKECSNFEKKFYKQHKKKIMLF